MESTQNSVHHIEGTQGTYTVHTSEDEVVYFGKARASVWSWQSDNQYWEEVDAKNSLTQEKVFHLKQVYWFDPNWLLEKLPKQMYHVYLRHGEKMPKSILSYYLRDGEGNEQEIGNFNPFLRSYPFDENLESVICTYAGTIDLRHVEGDHANVRMKLFNEGWTFNYTIEGSIFVPASDDEENEVPLIYVLPQDTLLAINKNEMAHVLKIAPGLYQEQIQEEEDLAIFGLTQ